MSLVSRIMQAFSGSSGGQTAVTIEANSTVGAIMGQTAEQLYASQPHLRTVVSFLASNVAQLPLKCFVRVDDSDRRRDTTSDAARLLRHPNPTMTGFDLINNLVSTLKLYDEAFWWVFPDPSRQEHWQIRPIQPSWIMTRTTDDWDEYDTITFVPPTGPDTSPITLRHQGPDGDFVAFHGWNPSDNRRGLSPINALRDILAEQISAWEFRRNVWQRGGQFQQYITRPKDVAKWTPTQARKWGEEFRRQWSANGGKAGGTPILEDGMEIHSTAFNAREAQWMEVSKLSLATCASVYHINPTMVGATEGATYANVREYARMLYTDCLGPDLRMIADRITMSLLPLLDAPADEYVEFDLQAKLNGSFEEQAQQIQSSVGAPWMTRNEARALANLPRIDGGDEIVTPLNVLVGGMASPNDSDGVTPSDPYASNGRRTLAKGAGRKSRGHPSDEDAKAMTGVLSGFFRRQRRTVLAAIGARSSKDDADWWDGRRWDKELSDDLLPVILSQTTAAARRSLKDIDVDPDEFDEERTVNYLKAVASSRAKGINITTLNQLQNALDGEFEDDSVKHDPAGVFDEAETTRSESAGRSLATSVAGWAVLEACRQAAPTRTTKTWVATSDNPRPSHAMLDGETVGYDEPFSNGAQWPGDTGALDVDEVAGCTCEVEITTP